MINSFKVQNPMDLVSRLYILEYFRDLGANKMHEGATPTERKEFFYKYIDEETNIESIDFNWENLIFVASMIQLENLAVKYLKEIEAIEEKRMEEVNKMIKADTKVEEVSINLRDIANSEIKRMHDDTRIL